MPLKIWLYNDELLCYIGKISLIFSISNFLSKLTTIIWNIFFCMNHQVYNYELKSFLIPYGQLVASVFSKFGIEIGPKVFWIRRNIHAIIEERFKNTSVKALIYWWLQVENYKLSCVKSKGKTKGLHSNFNGRGKRR